MEITFITVNQNGGVEAQLRCLLNELEWRRSFSKLATKQDLREMEIRMAVNTQDELADALDVLTLQQGAIALEQSNRFDALTATIAELTAAIAAGGTVTERVNTSLAALQAAAEALDQAIPNAPAPTT